MRRSFHLPGGRGRHVQVRRWLRSPLREARQEFGCGEGTLEPAPNPLREDPLLTFGQPTRAGHQEGRELPQVNIKILHLGPPADTDLPKRWRVIKSGHFRVELIR